MMNGSPPPRHGNRFSKTPPFLLPGLLVVIVILSFNYWRTSRLNKELLENVALANNQRQKIDHEFKDAEVARKQEIEKNSRCETQITQLQNDAEQQKTTHESDKNALSQKLTLIQEELDKLKVEHGELKEKHTQLEEERSSAQQSQTLELSSKTSLISTLQQTVASLNTSIVLLKQEKLQMLAYIGEELGKDGIEYLLSLKVTIPESYQMPPADQKPLCIKRAEDVCNANNIKNQMAINQNKLTNHEINSPNANQGQLGVAPTTKSTDLLKGGLPGLNSNSVQERAAPAPQNGNVAAVQAGGVAPAQGGGVAVPQDGGIAPAQIGGNFVPQAGGIAPAQTGGVVIPQAGGIAPAQTGGDVDPQVGGIAPAQNGVAALIGGGQGAVPAPQDGGAPGYAQNGADVNGQPGNDAGASATDVISGEKIDVVNGKDGDVAGNGTMQNVTSSVAMAGEIENKTVNSEQIGSTLASLVGGQKETNTTELPSGATKYPPTGVEDTHQKEAKIPVDGDKATQEDGTMVVGEKAKDGEAVPAEPHLRVAWNETSTGVASNNQTGVGEKVPGFDETGDSKPAGLVTPAPVQGIQDGTTFMTTEEPLEEELNQKVDKKENTYSGKNSDPAVNEVQVNESTPSEFEEEKKPEDDVIKPLPML